MIHLGFYGASTVSWRGDEQRRSFIDQVEDLIETTWGGGVVNQGKPQGSEERILFELKKTKKLDAAVIFHSLPKYIFLPKCDRDVSLDTVKPKRAKKLWTDHGNHIIPSRGDFHQEFFSYGNFGQVFKTEENFIEAMHILKEYTWRPELQVNRYQAAMLAIDKYLQFLDIPVFHSIVPEHTPDWLVPTHGYVDTKYTSMRWVDETNINPEFGNNLTLNQNNIIAKHLIQWLQEQF